MPYVNIRITKDGATAEQKAELIKGVTKLLVDILGKNPQTTMVVIDEVETPVLVPPSVSLFPVLTLFRGVLGAP